MAQVEKWWREALFIFVVDLSEHVLSEWTGRLLKVLKGYTEGRGARRTAGARSLDMSIHSCHYFEKYRSKWLADSTLHINCRSHRANVIQFCLSTPNLPNLPRQLTNIMTASLYFTFVNISTP